MTIDPGLLNKIKTSIRIGHNALDEEVDDNIVACLAELRVVGVLAEKLDATKELDPLIVSAVKMYCKANYTDDPAKAARYQAGYDSLKSCLMMAEGYGYKEAADE